MSDPKPCVHDLLNCFECEYPAPAPVENPEPYIIRRPTRVDKVLAKWESERDPVEKAGEVDFEVVTTLSEQRAERAEYEAEIAALRAEVEKLTRKTVHQFCCDNCGLTGTEYDRPILSRQKEESK